MSTLLSKVSFVNVPHHYSAFIPGKTPFSTYSSVVATLATYLVVIFGTQRVLNDRKPFQLTALFRLHNIILSVGSGLLLALIVEEIAPILWKRGLFAAICAEDSYTPRLEAYYIVNYLLKYLELFDTVCLALKKKPLTFLHVFHHSATAVLCFIQLQGRTSMSWAIISLNLVVHVAMYFYYFASAGGAKIWWKKYLTSMQIIQFVIDMGLVWTGTLSEGAYRYAPFIPHPGHCAGSKMAALSACSLLTSYLFLFINFYLQTYKRPTVVTGPTPSGARKFQKVHRTHERATSPTSMAARLPSRH